MEYIVVLCFFIEAIATVLAVPVYHRGSRAWAHEPVNLRRFKRQIGTTSGIGVPGIGGVSSGVGTGIGAGSAGTPAGVFPGAAVPAGLAQASGPLIQTPYVLNPALAALYAPYHPRIAVQEAFGPEVGLGGGFNLLPEDPFKDKIAFGGDFDIAIPSTFGIGVDPGVYPVNLFNSHLQNVQNYPNVNPQYYQYLINPALRQSLSPTGTFVPVGQGSGNFFPTGGTAAGTTSTG